MHGRRVDACHPEVFESADDAAVIVAEYEAVTHEQPGHGDKRDGDEAHHDHVQYAGRADHAAVEQGKAWSHQQDHRRGGQQPCGCGRIDLLHFGLPPGTEKSIGRGSVRLDEVLIGARRSRAALALVLGSGLGASVGELCSARQSLSRQSCPIFIPGHSVIGRFATLDSSSVMWPLKPGSMKPAVECVKRPRRPRLDLPSRRPARSFGRVHAPASNRARTRRDAGRRARPLSARPSW